MVLDDKTAMIDFFLITQMCFFVMYTYVKLVSTLS